MFRQLICLLFMVLAAHGQPIPFSHKTHVSTVKLTCTECHDPLAKFGDTVSIPDAPKCLDCHAFSVNPTPTRSQLNAFVEKKQPIPWVRIFALKDFVYFDHLYHLQNGAKCETCHGPDVTQDATKMTFCQPCHVKAGAKTACNTCHDQ